MREIKFRAWDKVMKCMVKVDSIHFPLGKPNKKDITVFNKEEFYYEWIYNYELMQYVGYKDKNGKEIYEGDILKADWGYHDDVRVVELDTFFYALLECTISDDMEVMEYTISDDIEVIGNIYENPELIK